MPREIQTIIVKKTRAKTREQATKIAAEYGKTYTSRETPNTWRFRQFPPDQCGGRFRAVKIGDGVLAVYCDKES